MHTSTSHHPRLLVSSTASAVALLALAVVAPACGEGTPKPPPGGGNQPVIPGQSVTVALPADKQAELDFLQKELTSSAAMSPDDFAQRYRVPFAATLGHDPLGALNLATLQASKLQLDTDEIAMLGQRGFVISQRKKFPTFTYGYEAIYSQDLPLFVSADSILHAVHRSYDDILKAVEQSSLVPEVEGMLADMRARLQAGAGAGLGDSSRADADLFLAVAASLLSETPKAPVAGAAAGTVAALVAKAVAAQGAEGLTLFGVDRNVDFSQFAPRGHYKGDPVLERYFRTMIWLGRIDFPIVDYDIAPAGKVIQKFNRRVLEAAMVLGDLMDDAIVARWSRIDTAIRAFVGEPDSMTPPQLGKLRADLGVKDLPQLAAVSGDDVVRAILAGGYGQQKIASQIIKTPLHEGTLPLAATFLLMGQRYVVDSHVFSNLVYDRLNKGEKRRMMPDPLDVAFAALRNDHAGALLAGEITSYRYAPELHGMRFLVQELGDDYWNANLYNLWLSALRALPPTAAELQGTGDAGLPGIAATEAWGRRLLNTQLASWAELRHDTILYAKQSYTAGVTCEFPDAYVEPNPAFFARIGALAQSGAGLPGLLDLSRNPALGARITSYFRNLESVAGILREMAEHQRTGMPHTAAHLDFINRAVRFQPGCGVPAGATGWYPELFFQMDKQLTFDPTIADVHTQPTDAAGNDVGRVLHVGTAHPRLMAVTVNTCSGPRAYVGLASSYHEVITEHYDRLDDQRWSASILAKAPADVPWMTDLVVR